MRVTSPNTQGFALARAVNDEGKGHIKHTEARQGESSSQ